MAYIELSSLTKRYDDITAVDDISLNIRNGEFFSIVGPSGCGKSTTLRLIAGFEEPTNGRIIIDGTDVSEVDPAERDVGLVFQSYALFPHMTAAENVEFGLRMQGTPEKERARRVDEALSLVELSEVADQFPEELSGGQQQRIALARALVIEPDVLLLDEPLSNLDQQLREELQTELKRIQQETGVTTIHVTHDQEEAMMLGDRMCVLRKGQIEQIATPETVYNYPETEFVSKFVGHANEFEATVKSGELSREIIPQAVSSLRFHCPPPKDQPPLGDGILIIRPSDIELNPTDPQQENEVRFNTQIDGKQFRGESVRYTLTYTEPGDQGLKIIAHGEQGHEIGETIAIAISIDDIIYYPEDTE